MTPLLFVFLLNLTFVFADEAPEEAAPSSYSEQGRKRLAENHKILADNVRVLQQNIETSRKNLKTLQQELDDLGQLENEHQELRKRFESYLKDGFARKVEQDKHKRKVEEETEKLESRKKKTDQESLPTDIRGRLMLLAKEKDELDRWQADATEKLSRVKELIVKLEESLGQLVQKKDSIRKQMTNWVENQKQFEKALGETQARKNTAEKVLNRVNPSKEKAG